MLNERIEHFEAGSDAVTQHQRHAGPLADVHPDLLAEHREQVFPRSTCLQPRPSWVQHDDIGDTGRAVFAVDLVRQGEHRLDTGGLLLCAHHRDSGAYL